MTKPFDYIVLNGKLTLYALKACTDQLRKLHGVSIEIVSYRETDGLYSVHVRAKDRDGREDEDFGVVALPDTLKGDARANSILKAVTKAKRRATLSICGLGFLDETEIEDIPASAKRAPPTDNEGAKPVSATRAPVRTIVPAPKHALKEGGIAEKAIEMRYAQAARSEQLVRNGPSRPFLASEAGKRMHPMNDELPDHSAPRKPDPDIPDFLDRRNREASFIDLVN
jgi:hypothetical protein